MLQRLKSWLVISLLCSNLAVGLLSLYYLNSINDRYASLIDVNMPLINRLRTLTRELGSVQRLVRRVTDPANEADWPALVESLDAASNSARAHAAQLSRLDFFKGTRHAQVLAQFSQEYDDKADEFLALIRGRKFAEANRFNTDVLRPTYDNYQQALDSAANFVQQQGADLRAKSEQDSRRFSGVLLAIAGWPVLAAGLLVALMAVLLLLLVISVFAPGYGGARSTSPPAA